MQTPDDRLLDLEATWLQHWETYNRLQEQAIHASANSTWNFNRPTYDQVAAPNYDACLFGAEGDANLQYCMYRCPLHHLKLCQRSAFRPLLIQDGTATDGLGERLVDHIDERGFVLHPYTQDRVIHPVTKKPVRLLLPELWAQSHPEDVVLALAPKEATPNG